MAFTVPQWRHLLSAYQLMNLMGSYVTASQARHYAHEALRLCCGAWQIREGEEWKYADCGITADLTPILDRPRPPLAWNKPQMLQALRGKITDYARIAAHLRGRGLFNGVVADTMAARWTAWREALDDPYFAHVVSADQAMQHVGLRLCDIARDVFPNDPSLELGYDATSDTAFRAISKVMLVGDNDDKAVAADWLRDRSQYAAAEHLSANTTGATPWWLRPEACTFSLT